MSTTFTKRLDAVLFAALFGIGLAAGSTLANGAQAGAGSCAQEIPINFGGGNDVVQDTDDGADENNSWNGDTGLDSLEALACPDRKVSGGPGSDPIIGGGSSVDDVNGNDGNDEIRGGTLDDLLEGGAGADLIIDEQGGDNDFAKGGTGNDTIDTRDGDGGDYADGGANTDNCLTNGSDVEDPSCES